MFYFSVLISSFCVVIFLLKNQILISDLLKIYDYPNNPRKLHKKKISLFGGIIIYILLLNYNINLYFFKVDSLDIFNNVSFVFLSIFFFLGLLDDKYNLGSYKRFLIFIILYFFLLKIDNKFIINQLSFSFAPKPLELGLFSIPITILCILLFVNSMNMLDGVNAISYFTFIFFLSIIFFKLSNNFFIIYLIFSIFICLILNILSISFFGSSGIYLVGSIISLIITSNYKSNNLGLVNCDEVVLWLLYPGLDMLRLFFQRIYQGRDPFSSDSNHLHHYLLAKKFSLISINFIIMFLVVMPSILFYIININFIYVFFISFLGYHLLLIYLKK